MSESEAVAAPVETPPAVLPAPENHDALSLSQHEAKFGGKANEAPPAAKVDPAPESAKPAKARGERPGHQATPEDVPRIRELTAKLRQAEQERDAIAARVRQSAPQAPAPPSPPEPEWDGQIPGDPKPTLESFKDADDPYAAWVKADARWDMRNEARVARWQQDQQQQATAEQTRMRGYLDRMQTHGAAHPEFAETVQPVLQQIHPKGALAGWLTASEIAPQIAAYWADHPDDFAAIATATVEQGLRLFARLEAKLETPSAASAVSPTGNGATTGSPALSLVPTPAPKPLNPVRTAPAAPADQAPGDDSMSIDAHERHYHPEKRRRG